MASCRSSSCSTQIAERGTFNQDLLCLAQGRLTGNLLAQLQETGTGGVFHQPRKQRGSQSSILSTRIMPMQLARGLHCAGAVEACQSGQTFPTGIAGFGFRRKPLVKSRHLQHETPPGF
jgi:hypothetical protein